MIVSAVFPVLANGTGETVLRLGHLIGIAILHSEYHTKLEPIVGHHIYCCAVSEIQIGVAAARETQGSF